MLLVELIYFEFDLFYLSSLSFSNAFSLGFVTKDFNSTKHCLKFYVCLLDSISLLTQMFVGVRPPTSTSSWISQKQDPHWDLFVVVVANFSFPLSSDFLYMLIDDNIGQTLEIRVI